MKDKKYKRKTYNADFKQSAVQLVLTSGKSAAEVARELGLADWQVREWVRSAKVAGADKTVAGTASIDKAENDRLKRENKRLQEEVEILKKAARYFAQNQK